MIATYRLEAVQSAISRPIESRPNGGSFWMRLIWSSTTEYASCGKKCWSVALSSSTDMFPMPRLRPAAAERSGRSWIRTVSRRAMMGTSAAMA